MFSMSTSDRWTSRRTSSRPAVALEVDAEAALVAVQRHELGAHTGGASGQAGQIGVRRLSTRITSAPKSASSLPVSVRRRRRRSRAPGRPPTAVGHGRCGGRRHSRLLVPMKRAPRRCARRPRSAVSEPDVLLAELEQPGRQRRSSVGDGPRRRRTRRPSRTGSASNTACRLSTGASGMPRSLRFVHQWTRRRVRRRSVRNRRSPPLRTARSSGPPSRPSRARRASLRCGEAAGPAHEAVSAPVRRVRDGAPGTELLGDRQHGVGRLHHRLVQRQLEVLPVARVHPVPQPDQREVHRHHPTDVVGDASRRQQRRSPGDPAQRQHAAAARRRTGSLAWYPL